MALLAVFGGGWALGRPGAVAAVLDARERPVAGEARPRAGEGRSRAAALRPPDALALLSGTPRLESPVPAERRARRTARGTGELRVAQGRSRRPGPGPLTLYAVEVEGGLGVSPRRFAKSVDSTLTGRRGWESSGRRAFRRVEGGPVAFRVSLASPATTDRLCGPLQTRRIYSCFHAGRVVLNVGRWREGAAGYRGRLADYRRYMVNHEVGHALGYGHRACPRRGARAPVMLQQTKGLGGCRPGPWPLASERGGPP